MSMISDNNVLMRNARKSVIESINPSIRLSIDSSTSELEARLIENVRLLIDKIDRLQSINRTTIVKQREQYTQLLEASLSSLSVIQSIGQSKNRTASSFNDPALPFNVAPRAKFSGLDNQTNKQSVKQKRQADAQAKRQSNMKSQLAKESLSSAQSPLKPSIKQATIRFNQPLSTRHEAVKKHHESVNRQIDLKQLIADKMRDFEGAKQRRIDLEQREKKRQFVSHTINDITQHPSSNSRSSNSKSSSHSINQSVGPGKYEVNYKTIEPRIAGPRYAAPHRSIVQSASQSVEESKEQVNSSTDPSTDSLIGPPRRIPGGKIAPPSKKRKIDHPVLQPDESLVQPVDQSQYDMAKQHVRGATSMRQSNKPSIQSIKAAEQQKEYDRLIDEHWKAKQQRIEQLEQQRVEQISASQIDSSNDLPSDQPSHQTINQPLSVISPNIEASSEKWRAPSFSFSKPKQAINQVVTPSSLSSIPEEPFDQSLNRSVIRRHGVSMSQMSGRDHLINQSDEREWLSVNHDTINQSINQSNKQSINIGKSSGRSIDYDDDQDIEGDALELNNLSKSHSKVAHSFGPGFGTDIQTNNQPTSDSRLFLDDESINQSAKQTKSFRFGQSNDSRLTDYSIDESGDDREFIGLDDLRSINRSIDPSVKSYTFSRAELLRNQTINQDDDDFDERNWMDESDSKPNKQSNKLGRANRFDDQVTDENIEQWQSIDNSVDQPDWSNKNKAMMFTSPSTQSVSISEPVESFSEHSFSQSINHVADWSKQAERFESVSRVNNQDDERGSVQNPVITSKALPNFAPSTKQSIKQSDDRDYQLVGYSNELVAGAFSRVDRFNRSINTSIDYHNHLINASTSFSHESVNQSIDHSTRFHHNDHSVDQSIVNPDLSSVKPDPRAHMFGKEERSSQLSDVSVNHSAYQTQSIDLSNDSSVQCFDVHVDEDRGVADINRTDKSSDRSILQARSFDSTSISFSHTDRFNQSLRPVDHTWLTLEDSHRIRGGAINRSGSQSNHRQEDGLVLDQSNSRAVVGGGFSQAARLDDHDELTDQLMLTLNQSNKVVGGSLNQSINQSLDPDLRPELDIRLVDRDFKLLSFAKATRLIDHPLDDQLVLNPYQSATRSDHQSFNQGNRFSELERDLRQASQSSNMCEQFTKPDWSQAERIQSTKWSDEQRLMLNSSISDSQSINGMIGKSQRFEESSRDLRPALDQSISPSMAQTGTFDQSDRFVVHHSDDQLTLNPNDLATSKFNRGFSVLFSQPNRFNELEPDLRDAIDPVIHSSATQSLKFNQAARFHDDESVDQMLLNPSIDQSSTHESIRSVSIDQAPRWTEAGHPAIIRSRAPPPLVASIAALIKARTTMHHNREGTETSNYMTGDYSSNHPE